MRVGVEVGGTFTDLIALDGGDVRVTKVPSVPRSPEEGVFAALAAANIPLARITDLVHGSTVATNAVLERKGGLTAFVTTAGFRDLLLIQRQDRPKIYTLSYQKPAAVVEHVGGECSTRPGLAALLTVNKVELFRRRHGRELVQRERPAAARRRHRCQRPRARPRAGEAGGSRAGGRRRRAGAGCTFGHVGEPYS